MKKFLILAAVAVFTLAIADVSLALHKQTKDSVDGSSIVRADGVAWGRHNLSAGGEHVTTDQTSEVCVFCHTPHHGRTDTAPLWNRASFQGYTLYSSNATNYTASSDFGSLESAGGVSAACLSCHDGVTTWDNLINYPGKGSESASTATTIGTTGFENAFGNFSEYARKMAGGNTSSRTNLGLGSGTGDAAADDHPINIYFSTDGTASLRDKTTVISAIPSNIGGAFGPGSNVQIDNDGILRTSNYWAVAGFINTDATIEDLLRSEDGSGTGGGLVECSSCHDPHYKNRTNPEIDHGYMSTVKGSGQASLNRWDYYNTNHATTTTFDDETNTDVDNDGSNNVEWGEIEVDGLFLRRVGGNSYSGVCLTCHGK